MCSGCRSWGGAEFLRFGHNLCAEDADVAATELLRFGDNLCAEGAEVGAALSFCVLSTTGVLRMQNLGGLVVGADLAGGVGVETLGVGVEVHELGGDAALGELGHDVVERGHS